jgi:PKD repeat protein
VLDLPTIGTFTDPGFDNAQNPNGASVETFTYSINWGDGTLADTGSTSRVNGGRNVATTGALGGSHIYAENGVYTVTVTITDDNNGSDTKTFQVTVGNVAPTLTVVPDQSIAEGSELVLADIGTFTDPGFDNAQNPNGASVEAFSYSINWGDGTAADTGTARRVNGGRGVLSTGSFDGSHIYAKEGTYTITATVTDDDNGSMVVTRVVTVEVVSMQAGGDLAVGGTADGDDHIILTTASGSQITAKLNGATLGTFAPTGRLLAFGQAGDDDIQVSGSLTLPAWLDGGDGDDRMHGGGGHDVLLGGAGADLLIGGQGRDLLIGGTGADRVIGNADDDILISGFTAYDASVIALASIMDEWTSGQSFADRVAALETGVGTGNAYRLQVSGAASEVTVYDDAAQDVMTGGAGLDWFIFNADGSARDSVTDMSTYESMYQDDIAFMGIVV